MLFSAVNFWRGLGRLLEVPFSFVLLKRHRNL
jgi:hypothetical protein